MILTIGSSNTFHTSTRGMSSRDVVVVGGGVAGCGTALKLADNGWKVTLLEKDKLLSGTSNRTPGRVNLGFHYPDLDTSVCVLRSAIKFAKTFPGFLIGENLDPSHPLRRGWYLITTDSLFSAKEVMCHYEKLQVVYSRLVEEDSTNAVFGDPELFVRILDISEYKELVDVEKIVIAFETAEHFLDWGKFKTYLCKEIREHDNISVHEHSEVIDIETHDTMRFTLLTKCDKETFNTNYVVNSTWNEIEKLNCLAGFHNPPGSKTNRLKVLLKIQLPEELRESHSMLFSVGPFGMLGNMGNGKGFVTDEKFSTVESCSEILITRTMQRLLNEGPTQEEFNFYGQKILEGISEYIPFLQSAKVEQIQFGIVQTYGAVDILDKHSPCHERAYYGVKSEGPGWISNPSMKLIYFVENAEVILNLLTQQFRQHGE